LFLPDPLANNLGGIDEIVKDGVVDSLSNKYNSNWADILHGTK